MKGRKYEVNQSGNGNNINTNGRKCLQQHFSWHFNIRYFFFTLFSLKSSHFYMPQNTLGMIMLRPTRFKIPKCKSIFAEKFSSQHVRKPGVFFQNQESKLSYQSQKVKHGEVPLPITTGIRVRVDLPAAQFNGKCNAHTFMKTNVPSDCVKNALYWSW